MQKSIFVVGATLAINFGNQLQQSLTIAVNRLIESINKAEDKSGRVYVKVRVPLRKWSRRK